jgi:hypothetical protein
MPLSEEIGMAIWNGFSKWWCERMHSKAMWPIHGRYVCRVCLREHPISWFQDDYADAGERLGRISRSKLGLHPSGRRAETL